MSDTAASGGAGPAATGSRSGSRPGAAPRPGSGGRQARGLDAATLIGLVGGFGLVGVAISMGGAWRAFVDLPSMLIVLGGTVAVTMVSFSLQDMRQALKILRQSFTHSTRDPGDAARQMLELAERSRRDGLLSLQNGIAALRREPFLARGVGLIVDGSPSKDAERVMRAEMHAIADRHMRSTGILRRAADVAPAMGLIGTLVGLVQMLGGLNDPSTIGPAMAIALLTTFYGAVLGNMVLAPLAGKLDMKSVEESLLNEIYLLGVGSIGRQENPRRLELMLNTILPPAKRTAVYR